MNGPNRSGAGAKNLDAWSWRQKFQFRLHSPGSNYCKHCPWLLSTGF